MVDIVRKKFFALAAVLTLSMTLLVGCGSDTNNSATSPTEDAVESGVPTETELPDNSDNGSTNDQGDRNTGDDAKDDAGNAVDDAVDGAGDAVKDATDGAKNAVDDAVDGTECAVDDMTGNEKQNNR